MGGANQRVATTEVATPTQNKYLSFTVADRVYAVSITAVKEVIEFEEVSLTPVPMVPTSILGAINVRGTAIPVVDASVLLNNTEFSVNSRTCVILVEVQSQDSLLEVGVVVDAVREVLQIPSESIEQAPNFGENISTQFIDGMGRVDDRFVVLLNLRYILCCGDDALLKGIESSASVAQQGVA